MLDSLPPELLAEIASHLDGFHFTQLWATGSKSLQLRLLAPRGVRKLSFRKQTLSWPLIAPLFAQLTQFDFTYLGNELEHPSQLSGHLSTLPPTLQSLKLSYPGAVLDFHRLLVSNPTSFPVLTSFCASNMLLKIFDEELLWCWPETLTVLNLQAEGSGYPFLLRAATLPPGLTQLKVTAITFSDAPRISNDGNITEGAAFPENLKHLELVLDATDIYWPAMIPVAIVKLCLNYWANHPNTTNWSLHTQFERFRSLEHFSMMISGFPNPAHEMDLRSLPATITYLELWAPWDQPPENEAFVMLPFLPPHITEMGSFWPECLPASFVPHLPRSLRTLDAIVPLKAANDLPPSLTNIHFGFDVYTIDEDYDTWTLPNAPLLLPLETVMFPTLTDKITRLLPSCLKNLAVNTGKITLECAKNIPKGVRKIHSECDNLLSDEATFRVLPRNLTCLESLAIRYRNYGSTNHVEQDILNLRTIDSASWLPRGLKVLRLGPLRFPSSPAWLNHLPPFIEEMRLEILIEHVENEEERMRNSGRHYFLNGPKVAEYDWSLVNMHEMRHLGAFSLQLDTAPSAKDLLLLMRALPRSRLWRFEIVFYNFHSSLVAELESQDVQEALPQSLTRFQPPEILLGGQIGGSIIASAKTP